MSFIDFPIFTGVSGDLRPWISWLEAFFVREKFKKLEKMNLAQSLLEGEAESWFYSIQKTLIFYDWRELKDKLLLRFGDVADSDRIRLIAEQDRFLREIRDEARIRRRKATSIPEKVTIWDTETEALVPTDTIPVTNLTESRETTDSTLATKSIQVAISDSVLDGGASIEKDESYEATMVKVEGDTTMFQILDSLEEELIIQNQVSVSKLEHSLQIHNDSPNVCENYHDVVGCDELCEHQNGTVSAYVPESKELSSQVVGLDDPHLEQIFDNGLQTELTEVLKLKDSMGLENPKKSRCLKAWRFNFKRKKKRIKKQHNHLKCNYASVRADWFTTLSLHENLQIVSGLLGFHVVYFRCHKAYGLARMINWSVRNDFTSAGIMDGNNAKLLKVTGDKLQFYGYVLEVTILRRLRIHQQQQKRKFAKSWRFKYKGIEEAVDIAQVTLLLQLILVDLKSHMRHKWKSKRLLHSGFDGNKLTQSHKLQVDKIELQLDQSDITFAGLKVEIASLLEVKCVWAEWLRHKVTMISAMLPTTIRRCYSWCGWLVFDRGKNNIISGDVQTILLVKAKVAHVDSLIVRIKVLLCYGVALGKEIQWAEIQKLSLYKELWNKSRLQEINLTDTKFLCEKVHRVSCLPLAAQFNSLEIIQAVLQQILQGDDEASTKIIDKLQKSLSIWHRWRRKASICVLPLQFSFFKLEDKLVFGEGSIDTIDDVASSSK